jgi:hypothetical protein
METSKVKSSSLSPSIGQHSRRLNDGPQRMMNTISHEGSPLRNFNQPAGPRIISQTQRPDFKMFGDLKEKMDSPRVLPTVQAESSVHTAEVNAAEVEDVSNPGSPLKHPSPLGMPYFHEIKEIQKQINSVFPSFPMQRNQDFLVSNLNLNRAGL